MHCYKSDSEAMAKADDAIKKSPKYPLIKDKYEDAIKEYNMWWKLVIDDKKNDDASRY